MHAAHAAARRLARHSLSLARMLDSDPHQLRTEAELRAKLFGPNLEPPVARDLATVISTLSPAWIAVDDLQFADPDSIAALRELVDRLVHVHQEAVERVRDDDVAWRARARA